MWICEFWIKINLESFIERYFESILFRFGKYSGYIVNFRVSLLSLNQSPRKSKIYTCEFFFSTNKATFAIIYE